MILRLTATTFLDELTDAERNAIGDWLRSHPLPRPMTVQGIDVISEGESVVWSIVETDPQRRCNPVWCDGGCVGRQPLRRRHRLSSTPPASLLHLFHPTHERTP